MVTQTKSDPKTRILDTVTRLFSDQGYQATGINQIIKEAKVAKASFYDHFGSKEELGVAYLQRVRQRKLDARERYLAQFDDPKARLLGLFDFLEHWTSETNMRGCHLLNIAPEFPDPHSKIRQDVTEYKAFLRDGIRALTREALQDTSNEAHVQSLGDTIFMLYEAAMVESQVFDDNWPIHQARETVRKLIE